MQCSRCGLIEDRIGSRVCANCGAALVAPGYVAPQPTRRGGAGWLVAVVAGGALVLGGAGFAYWRFSARPAAGEAELACEEGACPEIDPSRDTRLGVRSPDPDLGKVSLVIPAGAASDRIGVRVSHAREPLDLAVRAGPRPGKAIGRTIHLEPDGTTFAKPVTVKLPYSAPRAKSLAPTPIAIAVAVLHRTDGKRQLETIKPDAVDAEAGIVTVSLRHFSDVVAVAQPDDPNVIKLDDSAPPEPNAPVKQRKLENSEGCEKFSKLARQMPCVSVNSEAFFAEAGVDREWEAVGDYHCPLPGATDSLSGYRLCRLATYLDSEDGGATNFKGIGLWNHIPVPPMRTGHEVDLYNLLKDHLRRSPGVPLTQDDLLRLAIDSARGPDGEVNLASAALTAHNVVRNLARPDFWQNDMTPKDGKSVDTKGHVRICPDDKPNCGQGDPDTWGHSPSDPMYPIFLDAFGAKSSDGGETLRDLLKGHGLPGSYLGDVPFHNTLFAETPGVNPEFAGGCYYYFWVGMMAAAGGQTLTQLGIATESLLKSLKGEGARGKAETSCAHRGVDLVRCLTEAQRSTTRSECPDAGAPHVLATDAGHVTPRDAGHTAAPDAGGNAPPWLSGPPQPSGKTYDCSLVCVCRCTDESWSTIQGSGMECSEWSAFGDKCAAACNGYSGKRVTTSEMTQCEPPPGTVIECNDCLKKCVHSMGCAECCRGTQDKCAALTLKCSH